jgi:hypothetical protein
MNKNKVISLITFLSVTSIALLGAGLTVGKSVEHQSNLTLLASLFNRYNHKTPDNQLAFSQSTSSVLSEHTENPCGLSEFSTGLDTKSIVDFLYYQGVDYSFENRSVLATKFNIQNYKGTIDQNLLLLNLLKQESACLAKKT